LAPQKTWLIVKDSNKLEDAKSIFEDSGIDITLEAQMLGQLSSLLQPLEGTIRSNLIRHHSIDDVRGFASVTTEPTLQPLSGESFSYVSTTEH
jgi:hypothetical protein